MVMGRVLGAVAVLVALVVLGASPTRGQETSGELGLSVWGAGWWGRIPHVPWEVLGAGGDTVSRGPAARGHCRCVRAAPTAPLVLLVLCGGWECRAPGTTQFPVWGRCSPILLNPRISRWARCCSGSLRLSSSLHSPPPVSHPAPQHRTRSPLLGSPRVLSGSSLSPRRDIESSRGQDHASRAAVGEAGGTVGMGRGLCGASHPALPWAWGGEPASLTHLPVLTGVFQDLFEGECQFINGTEQVRLVVRKIYNRQQYVHFDSDVGLFVADTPLGEPDAKYWNSQPDLLEQKMAEVDTVCRHNYGVVTPFTVDRRGERVAEHLPGDRHKPSPWLAGGQRVHAVLGGHSLCPSHGTGPLYPPCVGTTGTALGWAIPVLSQSFPALCPSPPVQPEVEIYPMQSSSLPQTDRLVCAVMDFYPAEIEVKWFKNGQEETEHVVSTDVIQNGDWTYQVLVILETTPQRGETYTCQVEHVSLERPLTQLWGKVLPCPAPWGGEGDGPPSPDALLPAPQSCSRTAPGARC